MYFILYCRCHQFFFHLIDVLGTFAPHITSFKKLFVAALILLSYYSRKIRRWIRQEIPVNHYRFVQIIIKGHRGIEYQFLSRIATVEILQFDGNFRDKR